MPRIFFYKMRQFAHMQLKLPSPVKSHQIKPLQRLIFRVQHQKLSRQNRTIVRLAGIYDLDHGKGKSIRIFATTGINVPLFKCIGIHINHY